MTNWNKLLTWFDHQGRKLPWRNTRNPYRILVSEIMLQQTQVSRVIDFYRAWMKRFPTWKALSKATNADIIHAWAGLGYNRRGLMLRDIAKTITAHGIPKTRLEWLALKGIGPYTADALAVFSLHERVWPIDTNLRRVGGRIWLGKPYPQPIHDNSIKKKAETALEQAPRHYDLPQAAFDLATAICTKTPNCITCPLKDECLAASKFLSGKVRTPKRMIKKVAENIEPGKQYPDRIYRGRILALIRQKPHHISKIGPLIDPNFSKKDQTWINSMITRLKKDDLLKISKGKISLP